ncbi:zinc finger CCHC domain-containing protein 14-like [Polypterus senegalus]|uniref:zinc finger CCHC domain-containing protein 14-like n=1 Tax=Polypterus senegalus TaxID=55291 RepID=UPI0019644F21|nr:zinc finger CCHC domain-containing protein 14-like [Polypterus senegalus]
MAPHSAGVDSYYMQDKNHSDLEADLRHLSSLPSHVLRNNYIKKFFCTSSVIPCVQNLSYNSSSQHKVTFNTAVRPICGVASIQSSNSCSTTILQPSLFSPSFSASQTMSILSTTGPQTDNLTSTSGLSSTGSQLSNSLQTPPNPEQNGILDWLRKLRLHKYYPVFKQLTMEKFLALTEEDLNKYDLTQGAKKKLKTQLELQKEKSEKLYQFPVASTGVARITPTSHLGQFQPVQAKTNAVELRVDMEQCLHPYARDSSISSGYSSAPSSPMGLHTKDETFDTMEQQSDRRKESTSECPDKEKPTSLSNTFMAAGVPRPTAQVLPVQNDIGANTSSHLPLPVISSNISPSRVLCSVRKPERGNSRMPSPVSMEDRNKTLQGSTGPSNGIKIEKRFPNIGLEVASVHPASNSAVLLEKNTLPVSLMNFAGRTKVSLSTVDTVNRVSQQPALMIETSTASAATSSTVYHVSHPPLKLQVTPSLPVDASGTGHMVYTSGVPIKSVPPAVVNSRTAPYSSNTKVAFSAMNTVPVAAVPGTYCSNNSITSSSTHPSGSFSNVLTVPSSPVSSASPSLSSLAENSCYSSANSSNSGSGILNQNLQQQPGCVCSSCGCSGSCGSYNTVSASYASYFQHPFSGPSMFTLPFLHFSPLCNSSYVNPQQYNTTTGFSYPVLPPPMYNSSLTGDSSMSSQSGFVMSPVQNFITGASGLYQAQGVMGSTSVTGLKKSVNVSCYNCGISGHRAHDCKLPPMDSNQQGTFRLKYAPPSENLDAAD